jgi:hypothetical protein
MRARATLEAEIWVLRQQINVLRRAAPRRQSFGIFDRLIFVGLYRLFPVTQQFNTTTSMGRLTLNVLLSFAQFEREVTSERIRDKIAASKRKGLWVGGPAPWLFDEGKQNCCDRGRGRKGSADLPALSGTRRRQRTGARPPRAERQNQGKTAGNGCDSGRRSLWPRLTILSAAESLLYR